MGQPRSVNRPDVPPTKKQKKNAKFRFACEQDTSTHTAAYWAAAACQLVQPRHEGRILYPRSLPACETRKDSAPPFKLPVCCLTGCCSCAMSSEPPSAGATARAACAALLRTTPLARVDAAACAALAAQLPDAAAVAAVCDAAPGVRFPLPFPSLEAEVNFLSLLALCRFGGGWEDAGGLEGLLKGEPVADRALRGLFSLHVGGSKLDADALQSLTEFSMASAWGLRLQEDVPHKTLPVVSVAQDTAVRPLLRLLHDTLADAGRRLWERRCASLGALVLSLTDPNSAGVFSCSATAFVSKLAAALPSFADASPLPLYSKGVQLARDLRRRFAGTQHAPRFAFAPDFRSLHAPADAPLLRALRAAGCVRLAGDDEKDGTIGGTSDGTIAPPAAHAAAGKRAPPLPKAGGAAEAAARAACVAAVAAVAAGTASQPQEEVAVAAWIVALHGDAKGTGEGLRVRDTVFW